MLSAPPRHRFYARLAAFFIFSAAPVSAQTLETFVLSVGGISQGTGCSTFSAPAPVFSFFGPLGVPMPIPGYAPCSIDGGMTDQIQALAPLTDSYGVAASWSTNTFDGTSGALATYGFISSVGHADYSGGTSSLTVAGSEAVGRWNDSFTLTSPSVINGQTGNLVLKITVAGGLSTTGTGFAGVDLYLGVDAGTPAVVFRSGASNPFANAFVFSATGTGLGGFVLSPGAMSGSGEVSTVQIPFTFGTPLDLKLGMLSVALPGLTSIIDAQFSANVTGLAVSLTGGAPVNDFVVSTASGTQYGTGGVVDVSPGGVPNGSFAGRLLVLNNPSRGGADLRFELARPGAARLVITDAAGRLIRTLRKDSFAAGSQLARWDGRSENGAPLASGVYFARLSWQQGSTSARFVLLR